ncbi:MAG: hypothetical protein ABEI07_01690 [Candidatus Nanohaloarchaea archaeon]
MAFLKTEDACDNCGKDLSGVGNVVEEGNHEFCSKDCREEYEKEHDHEGEDEEEVCEFC